MVSEKPSKIGKKGNKRISTQKGQGVGIMKKQRITGTQNTIGAQGGKDNTPVDDANTTAVVSVEGSVQSMVGKEDMERLFTKIELLEASFQKTVQKLENLEKKVGNLEQKVPRDVTYVKTSAAKSDLTAGTDVGFNDHLTKVIRAFVREKFFKVVKFVTDANAEAIVKQAMHENRIHPMEGQTEGAFLQQCKQIVKTTFNCLRGHMQSQARKNFLSKIGCLSLLLCSQCHIGSSPPNLSPLCQVRGREMVQINSLLGFLEQSKFISTRKKAQWLSFMKITEDMNMATAMRTFSGLLRMS